MNPTLPDQPPEFHETLLFSLAFRMARLAPGGAVPQKS
jgi:hypothetical protein